MLRDERRHSHGAPSKGTSWRRTALDALALAAILLACLGYVLRDTDSEQEPAFARAAEESRVDGTGDEDSLVLHVTCQESGEERLGALPIAIGLSPPFDPFAPIRAEGVTDSKGRVQFSIPWHEVEAARSRSGHRLWVRVVGPGWQHETNARLPPARRRLLEITVFVDRGATLRGRVLDSSGQPVAARVRCKPAAENRFEFDNAEDSRRDGWFEVNVDREGTYDVVAEADDVGTAALRGVSIHAASLLEPVELCVRGPGVLRGHVRDTTGRPLGYLELLVHQASLDDERDGRVLPERRACALDLEGHGRLLATLETDEDGSFEARGLRSDRYVIRARTNPRSQGHPWLLTPTAVASDGQPLELELARPHLDVRIENPDGSAWPGPVALEWRVPYFGLPDEWPEYATLAVVPVPEDGHCEDPFLDPPARRLGDEYVVEIDAGRRYLVGLLGAGQPWHPVEVAVPERADRLEVTLVARSEVAFGELTVSAFDHRGRAIDEGLAIQIEQTEGGTPLLRSDWYRFVCPRRFRLPEGEYRLVVEGEPMISFQHGVLLEPRRHGRFKTPVRVAAERATHVDARLPPGARLRLRMTGEIRAEDRQAIRADYAGIDLGDLLEARAGLASVTLLAEGRWPEPVSFTAWSSPFWKGDQYLVTELPLGCDELSARLPAGSFTLEARLPGGRVVSTPLLLVDGETSKVTLAFE